MKRFIMSEEEKSRILSMHKSAIKRQYLKEESEPTNQNEWVVVAERKLKRDAVNINSIPENDYYYSNSFPTLLAVREGKDNFPMVYEWSTKNKFYHVPQFVMKGYIQDGEMKANFGDKGIENFNLDKKFNVPQDVLINVYSRWWGSVTEENKQKFQKFFSSNKERALDTYRSFPDYLKKIMNLQIG